MSSTEGPDVEPTKRPASDQPVAAGPGGQPLASSAPVGGAGPPPPPQWYPTAQNPAFAPVARPARVPWVNPQRKAAAIIISVVAAVVLFGLGALVAAVALPDRGRAPFQRSRVVLPERPYGQPGGPRVFHTGVVLPTQTVTATVVAPAPASTS